MGEKQPQTKDAVSVSEMARMVGLSRARFYQLVKGGVFPEPRRHPETNRPYYDEEQQRTCLEVRRRNCGADGQPVLFYPERKRAGAGPKRPGRGKNEGLLDGVRGLGLTGVTAGQVAEALKELYPQGRPGADDAEVIRCVFLHLRRQGPGGKSGE